MYELYDSNTPIKRSGCRDDLHVRATYMIRCMSDVASMYGIYELHDS